MLPVTGNVNAQPRKISCKLEIGGNTITSVKMLTYNTDWTGNITVGNVVSSYISVTLPTPIFSLAGANVTLSMGIGDPAEWVSIGIFRVDEESIRTKQGYTSFNAYDKLYYSVNTYHSTGDKSLQTICNEVCSAIGITSATLSASITIDSSILDGYTLRDVLSFIAGYQGKNAYLSPSGALDLRWFTSSSYTADGTRANIPFIGESDCTIGRWICQTQDGVIDAGSGEGIYFTCPFMTAARLSSLQQGQSLTYRKAEVDIPYGNFCLQSGDIITVTTVQNQTLTVPIMNNSWTYDGGLSSAVTSYGVSDYQGTANNAERSLSVRRVQRQLAVNRAASDLKIASEKITGASGGYIRINFGGDGKTAALLIMDTEDISTAQNVWVFNQGGLGHFPNGYDPTAQANVALTYDGWVVAERISGTLISGVGIENVDNALTTKPKIALANGCIHFTETYDYSGTSPQVTDIGKLEYLARSSQSTAATLALTCQYGNNITIGEYGYPKFVYISDHGNDETFRMYGKMKMWDDSGISAVYSAQALIDIVDSGAKNRSTVSGGNVGGAGFIITDTAINLPAGDYVFYWINTSTSVSTVINCYTSDNTRVVNENKWNSAVESREINVPQDCVKFNFWSTGANTITDLMICPKVLWDISQNYVPYAPTNAELYQMIQNL